MTTSRYRIVANVRTWMILVRRPEDDWCDGYSLLLTLRRLEPNEGFGL